MRKPRVKRDRPLRDVMKKSPALYITMLCIWAVLLLVLSLIFHGGVLPVLLIVVTGYSSLVLLFFSNVRYTEAETERIDEKTVEFTLRSNKIFRYQQVKE